MFAEMFVIEILAFVSAEDAKIYSFMVTVVVARQAACTLVVPCDSLVYYVNVLLWANFYTNLAESTFACRVKIFIRY